MLVLRIIVVFACAVFMVLVCRQVSRGRLLLRYSLLWLTLALVTILVSVFPEPIYALSHYFGFDTPSNFVFFVALFFLLIICLSLSVVVSKQAIRMKNLVQAQALMEKRLQDIRNGNTAVYGNDGGSTEIQ